MIQKSLWLPQLKRSLVLHYGSNNGLRYGRVMMADQVTLAFLPSDILYTHQHVT